MVEPKIEIMRMNLSAENILLLPEGDETVIERVPIPGCNMWQVRCTVGYISGL
jgi:hypothetical protein